jgi:hypothetical protein
MADGIYLPADDRRHFVAWSNLNKDDERFQDGYWRDLWNWYEDGGFAHVTAYLAKRDISQFDPKAPPERTPAFWTIVDAGRAPETSELADVIERLGDPDSFTLDQLRGFASDDFSNWLSDRKNRRIIPHRLESCGYLPVRNADAPSDGLWKIDGKRQAVYVRKLLPLSDQIAAARRAAGQGSW